MVELTLPEKQLIILDILKDIDAFCRENNIPYSLAGGSLLGAIRHGGFIPWDDDADLYMLRDDFERFIKLYKSPKYKLLYNERGKDYYFVNNFIKVCDTTTTTYFKRMPNRYGINVDIFPLDPVPLDKKERHKYMRRTMHYQKRLHHKQLHDWNSVRKTFMHSLDWWWDKCQERVHHDLYKDSPLLAHIFPYNFSALIDRTSFENLQELDFAGNKFLAISNPEKYLTSLYGSDYMTPKVYAHDHPVFRLPDKPEEHNS